MLLRIGVGYHFFKEGTGKLRGGDFDAQYFLIDAKGPLAPAFRSLVRDVDGRERFGVAETVQDDERRIELSADLTELLWNDFLDRAFEVYDFGSEQRRSSIATKRDDLAAEIRQAREEQNTRINTTLLESERDRLEQVSLAIRDQPQAAKKILEQHLQAFKQWQTSNRVELIEYYQTDDRLAGFDRDGANRSVVAREVESLRGQVDEIKQERRARLNSWKADVNAIWDSLEMQINDLAVDEQQNRDRTILEVHRPYDQRSSNLKIINRIIPWFDTIVGVLLIIGLFSRLASLAGAGFLLSVIASQPPWIPGTTPTYYQAVELLALLVIFATCAGRCGGLDYFLHATSRKMPTREEIEAEAERAAA